MVEKSGIETWLAHYVVFLWKKPLSQYSLKKPLSTQDLEMGAGKLLWMPGEMLEGKVAMDKHLIKGEGGGGELQ